MYFNELSGEQRRQLINSQQAFEAWREADVDKRRRFLGSVRWLERSGTEYLHRKIGGVETSLGPRNEETNKAYAAFLNGRASNKERLEALSAKLDEMAPINQAMGIARLPTIAARIIRRCDEKGLLGKQIFIVGTNALFAYEALTGVQFSSGLIASDDIDLLYDARQKLSLAIEKGISEGGLIGLLRQVDESFALPRPRNFRASNKGGYMVDLIRPQSRDVFKKGTRAAVTDLPDDMEGAAIFGLDWLINTPKVEATVLDERGYPARMVVIDPRAFALHKAWVAKKDDREPIKAKRDDEHARAAALIATRYLGLSFDSPEISALPTALRDMAPDLVEQSKILSRSESPNW